MRVRRNAGAVLGVTGAGNKSQTWRLGEPRHGGQAAACAPGRFSGRGIRGRPAGWGESCLASGQALRPSELQTPLHCKTRVMVVRLPTGWSEEHENTQHSARPGAWHVAR